MATPPVGLMQNALGALTQSGLNVQKEVEVTLQLQQEKIDQTKAVIAEQAAKIAALEARIVQINAQKEGEIATLRQEKEAREGYLQRGIDALNDKVAYQQRGIDALNNEVARLSNLLSEYKDIIWGFANKKFDTAWDKIRRFRVLS